MTRPGSVQGTDPRHACPECGGHRLVGDPTGLRVDHAVRCSIRSAEDSRKVADLDAVGGPRRQRGHADPIRRPPTAAERTLLAAFGHPADEIAEVVVTRSSPLGGLVRRDFRLDDGTVLDLDAPTPEPEPSTTEPSTTQPSTEEST